MRPRQAGTLGHPRHDRGIADRPVAVASRGVAEPLLKRPIRIRAVVPPPARLERLLDDAASLDGSEIEFLAVEARRARRTPRYTEALLAIRRAADSSGRGELVTRAGMQAEHLVASAAKSQSPAGLEDRARWSVVVAEASWRAGDAARALVVSDLITSTHLTELTSAWDAARAGRSR